MTWKRFSVNVINFICTMYPTQVKFNFAFLVNLILNFRRRNQRSRDEQQKIYDDKDRETFGDDFVADHQKQV